MKYITTCEVCGRADIGKLILKKLKKEKQKLHNETYDESDEPHDEGILGQIEGIEKAMSIVEAIDNGTY